MKKTLTHIAAVAVMLAVACVYFSPALSGDVVMQGDIQKYEAMVKETKDYQSQTGEYVHWNSAMFSGMPGYQVGGNPPVKSVFTPIKNVLTLEFLGLDRSVGVLFFYLIGFYVAMLVLGASPWLSLLGALAFGLGSYNIIIVEAGHITKAWAMAMSAPILASMVLALRRPDADGKKGSDWLWGGILFACALSLQLLCNHVQITYYTVIGAFILGVVYLVYAFKDKYFGKFMAGVGILLAGCAFAFACNARTLMVSMEYSKQTMRGGNAITVTPESLYNDDEPASIGGKQGGLDIDYAFSWSYGIGETYTLLVPGAMGGGSGEKSREGSEYAKLIDQQPMSQSQKELYKDNAPYYWGDQPFTSGPVYFGAIVVFLFVLGCMLVKGPERWWLILATLVAVVLSWGRHCLPINEFLFNHLPMYNKFRTPSMSLVLANVTMVMMAVLALKSLMESVQRLRDSDRKQKGGENQELRKQLNRALYWAGGITGGLILVVLIVGSSQFSFSNPNDQSEIASMLVSDRKALFRADSFRSLAFILLAFAGLWLYVNEKIKKSGILIALLSVLIVVDLWGVDRRYLDKKNFVDPRQTRLHPDPWDQKIDEQAAHFGDQDYRVLNLATNTFNDSKPAAFHHQIGGYSAVKMRRYQDLIDFYISRHINMQVLNMLNARYVVVQNGEVQRNPDALGNCWLVRDVKAVSTPDEEILSLNDFDPATTAIVNTDEFPLPETESAIDSTDRIEMEHQQPYNPDCVKYRSHTSDERLAVFSEIYYAPDWRAYIDGKPAEYLRVNFVLRGIFIPSGDHEIVFRNEAPLFHKMDKVTLLASILLVVLVAGAVVVYYRKRKKE